MSKIGILTAPKYVGFACPVLYMNMSIRNRRQPPFSKRLKRTLSIQWTLMDLNIILGMMNSHLTHSMSTLKSKGAMRIVTLSISAPLVN